MHTRHCIKDIYLYNKKIGVIKRLGQLNYRCVKIMILKHLEIYGMELNNYAPVDTKLDY